MIALAANQCHFMIFLASAVQTTEDVPGLYDPLFPCPDWFTMKDAGHSESLIPIFRFWGLEASTNRWSPWTSGTQSGCPSSAISIHFPPAFSGRQLCTLEIVSPFTLYLNWQLIIYELQLWRLHFGGIQGAILCGGYVLWGYLYGIAKDEPWWF